MVVVREMPGKGRLCATTFERFFCPRMGRTNGLPNWQFLKLHYFPRSTLRMPSRHGFGVASLGTNLQLSMAFSDNHLRIQLPPRKSGTRAYAFSIFRSEPALIRQLLELFPAAIGGGQLLLQFL
jgi:hypothetical protein